MFKKEAKKELLKKIKELRLHAIKSEEEDRPDKVSSKLVSWKQYFNGYLDALNNVEQEVKSFFRK